MERWPYQRGYTTRNFHVTGGHEAEAQAAERAKRPSRAALFVMRLLGYRGSFGRLPDAHRSGPSNRRRRGRPGARS